MPKARKSTSRALHFQVSPWQTRLGKENAAAGHDDTTDVQFVDLVKPAQEEPLEAAGPSRVAQLANGDAPWISKGRKGAQPPNRRVCLQGRTGTCMVKRLHVQADVESLVYAYSQSEEPSSQQAPIPAVGSTVAPAEAAAGSIERQQDGKPDAEEPVQEQDTEAGAACSNAHDMEDDGFDLQPSSSCSSALQGVCHLALLPSGHMSGHVIQDRTHRPFGVMARCVSFPSATPGCMEDADVDVLKLRLLNFQVRTRVSQHTRAWL